MVFASTALLVPAQDSNREQFAPGGWTGVPTSLRGRERGRQGAWEVGGNVVRREAPQVPHRARLRRRGEKLNLHFLALVLDGVYASRGPFARPRFRPPKSLTDADVVEVTALLQRRVLRCLARCDRLRRDPQGVLPARESRPRVAFVQSGRRSRG